MEQNGKFREVIKIHQVGSVDVSAVIHGNPLKHISLKHQTCQHAGGITGNVNGISQ